MTQQSTRWVVIEYVQVTRRRQNGDRIEEVVEYYFFRNGQWWKIIDPNRKFPHDPNLIDLGDFEPPPNFVAADAAKQASLNREFFPDGWEDFWDGFEESSKRQLQIMLHIALAMNVDEDTLRLMEEIRQRRQRGESWDDVLGRYAVRLLAMLLVAAVFRRLFGPLKRLFMFLLRRLRGRRLARSLLRAADVVDDIVRVDVNDEARRRGITGFSMAGTINRADRRLEVGPGINTWRIPDEMRGMCLGAELLKAFILQLLEVARAQGLREVRISRSASSAAGGRMFQKAGFRKVPGRDPLIGDWEFTRGV